jgi:hypothetical protein
VSREKEAGSGAEAHPEEEKSDDPAFQASEAEKKAAWLATDHGRELNAEASRRARLKKKLTAEARSRAKRRKRAAPAKAR